MPGNPSPRQVLAANLKELLRIHKISAPTVAKKAGIDPKSVNNMINAKVEPRRENVDAVAKVFGYTGWQLIRRNITKDMPKATELEGLIEKYIDATPEERATILKVAEMTGIYRTKP